LGGLLLVLLGVMAMAMTQAAGHLFSWLVVTREFLVSRVFRWLAIRRLGYRPRPGLRGRKLGPFFRMAALYGLAILSYQLCFHVDVFMVRALCGEEALGAYAAAFRPMNPMLRVAGLLMLPMLPVIARTALSNRERFVGQVVRSSEVLVGLGGLGAVAAIMLAEDLLQLLYGDKYVSGPLSTVEALRWLAVALAVVFSSTAFTTALLAAGRERWLCILGLAVNVAGNLVFLPTHGFTAAAATTAATEALLASGAIVCLVRTAPVSGIRPIFVLTLAPAAILGFVLYWLPGPSPWRIVAGTLLGLAGLAFLVLGPPGRRLRRTLADLAS
jgi:O-antigen/teichoic acid export membrane protein